MHKNATKCKQNTNQMVHKQTWSIKNYDLRLRRIIAQPKILKSVILALEIVVSIFTTQSTWSDGVFARGRTILFG
jgi:hypothetical protein